ncbi:MAG: NAD(+)/NADH kinase [bacterium]
MDKVLIFQKANHNEAQSLSKDIRDFFNKQGIKTYIANADAPSDMYDGVELTVVIGGDGTFLGAVRDLGAMIPVEKQLPPILGINTGSLGFLTESSVNEWKEVIKKGLAQGFIIEERSMLGVSIGDAKQQHAVLNDVVINRKDVARMIDFDVYYNSEFVSNTKADGVIISTPTGSTAYSLAAGGPILHPCIPAFVITPVSPHTLTNRPIVVADSGLIEVQIRVPKDEVLITLDGQTGVYAKTDQKIKIKKFCRNLRLIRPNDATYFNILRNKLSFGKRG